jgi:hypothetical protein
MKKLLIILSLLITVNAITPARADYSDHVVPALKIAGGTLAAATAIASGAITGMLIKDVFNEYEYEFDLICRRYNNPKLALLVTPTCISAAILSAMAFGCAKSMKISPTMKIIGGSLMGLSSLAVGACGIMSPNYYLPRYTPLMLSPEEELAEKAASPVTAYPLPGKIFAIAAICPTILAAITLKSAANDLNLG